VVHLQVVAVLLLVVVLQAVVAAVVLQVEDIVEGINPNEDYITIDITKDGLALMYRSVCFHLDKWPGGDSFEQQGLMLMKDNLFRLLLESQFRKP
jgi:hypothetical protein